MSLKSSTELTASEAAAPAGVAAVSTGVGRRRLLRAGLAATPVILAVSGRSAMAGSNVAGQPCPRGLSPMAWYSLSVKNGQQVNCETTSHTVQGSAGSGYSPGGWKPQTSAGKIDPPWPATCVPFDGYNAGAPSGQQCSSNTNFSTGTVFKGVFTTGSFTFGNNTFSEILLNADYPIPSGQNNPNKLQSSGSLEFHLCAAYLNALTVPNYPMTVAEVLELGNSRKIAGFSVDAATIKAFIEQTYHTSQLNNY